MASRWSSYPTSIFSRQSALAAQFDAVNLAQGFPDFDGPEEIITAAQQAIASGKNQYSPSAGILPLRERVAAYQHSRSGLSYDPESEVTIVSGATEGIMCALTSLFEPGQEILTFDPHYESYPYNCKMAGLKLRSTPLLAPDYRFDVEALEQLITPASRGLLLNTPHNPSGRVASRAELEALAAFAQRHDLIVITDEVYQELVYPGYQHLTLASLEGMRQRCVVISSTSKTFSMTGWKIGFVYAPEEMSRAIRNYHANTVFCSATPLQHAMLAAFDLAEDYFTTFRQEYGQRRQYLCSKLEELGFGVVWPEGSYFVLMDYSRYSDQPDTEVASQLMQQAKVASIPTSGFYLDQELAKNLRVLRLGFCKDLATLELAISRLANWV